MDIVMLYLLYNTQDVLYGTVLSDRLHAVWFIRNTVKFGIDLFQKFSENFPSFVAYLLSFCFLFFPQILIVSI